GLSSPILDIGLDFAGLRTYSGVKTCIGMYGAMFRALQGSGGILHGTLRRIGTSLVSGNLRMLSWFGSNIPTFEESSNYPHVDIDFSRGDGKFALQIRAPLSRVPNRGNLGKVVFYLLGGPLAAKDVTADLYFSIFIEGIKESVVPSVLQYSEMSCNWAEISAIVGTGQTIIVPNHICDWKLSNATVALKNNPLSAIFGACGYFRGKLEMSLTWTANGKLSDAGSRLWIGKCWGDPKRAEVLESTVTNVYIPGSCSFVLDVGDYTGCNKPGNMPASLTNETQHINIWVEDGSKIGNLQLSIRLLPGFAFYGRSVLLSG
ncbi:capsid protein, partial [Apricot latent ringspot virus]